MFTAAELKEKRVEDLNKLCFDLRVDGFWRLETKQQFVDAILDHQSKNPAKAPASTAAATEPAPENTPARAPRRLKGNLANPTLRALVYADPETTEEIMFQASDKEVAPVTLRLNDDKLVFPRGEWHPVPSRFLSACLDPTTYKVPVWTDNGMEQRQVARYSYRTRPVQKKKEAA